MPSFSEISSTTSNWAWMPFWDLLHVSRSSAYISKCIGTPPGKAMIPSVILHRFSANPISTYSGANSGDQPEP
eukprot:406618-Karenia_brevis.AAC.1